MIISLVIIVFEIIPLIIFSFLVSNVQTSTATYNEYIPSVVTVETTSNDTTTNYLEYSFYFDTSTNVQIVVCGEDIPIGEYTYSINENSSVSLTLMQDKGLDEPGGTELVADYNFECVEGQQLYMEGEYGSFTIVPTTPVKDENYVAKETTQMATTYNIDGTITQEVCTKNNVIVECKTLSTYDELVKKASSIMESGTLMYEITETMSKGKFFTTCTSSNYGNIPCEQAITYDELVSKIDSEDKDKR